VYVKHFLLFLRNNIVYIFSLIRAQGRGVYRSTLANLIDADLHDQSVTVYVKRLRETFRRLDPTFDQIECLKGFGAYRWVQAASV